LSNNEELAMPIAENSAHSQTAADDDDGERWAHSVTVHGCNADKMETGQREPPVLSRLQSQYFTPIMPWISASYTQHVP
jgi:hypothetical protein